MNARELAGEIDLIAASLADDTLSPTEAAEMLAGIAQNLRELANGVQS